MLENLKKFRASLESKIATKGIKATLLEAMTIEEKKKPFSLEAFVKTLVFTLIIMLVFCLGFALGDMMIENSRKISIESQDRRLKETLDAYQMYCKQDSSPLNINSQVCKNLLIKLENLSK